MFSWIMLHISLSIHARQRHVRGLKFESIWKFLKLVYLAFSYLWLIYKFLVFEVEIFQKLVKSIIKLNSGGIGRGLIGWSANPTPPPFLVWRNKVEKAEKDCEHYGRNWGKHSGQLLYYNFYLVAFACILCSNNFQFRFQFSNCNIFWCASLILQPQGPSAPLPFSWKKKKCGSASGNEICLDM